MMVRVGLGAVVAALVMVSGSPAAASVPEAEPGPGQVRASQWYLEELGVLKAQKVTRGEGVTVCVVDNPVTRSSAGLRGVRWGENASISKPPDDLQKYHGDQMTMMIAGQGADGPLGVAPAATVVTAEVGLGLGPSERQQDVERGIAACVDAGAKVINMSLVWEALDRRAIAYAQERDVVLVAGTGNRGEYGNAKRISLPSGSFGVLAVSGVNESLKIDKGATTAGAFFVDTMNRTPQPDDVAGTAVMGPSSWQGWEGFGACKGFVYPVGGGGAPVTYEVGCGTSDATAVVSGVAALVRAAHPELNAANVVNRIIRTAKPPTDGSKVPSSVYGFGVVDAYAAVTADVPTVEFNPLGSEFTGSHGVWDERVVPKRAEPAVGSNPGKADWQASTVPAIDAEFEDVGTGKSGASESPGAEGSGASGFALPGGLLLWGGIAFAVLAVLVAGAVLLLTRRRSTGGPR